MNSIGFLLRNPCGKAGSRLSWRGTEFLIGRNRIRSGCWKTRSAVSCVLLRHCGVLCVRLIPRDSRALHVIVFEQPPRNGCTMSL